MIGNTSKVITVAVTSPPIITMAKGFCDSEPIPVLMAAGISPIEAIKAVITTGLVLTITAFRMESFNENFSFKLL